MIAALRDLLRHHELLLVITRRDIQVKYKQSVMGILWAVLMPLLVVLSGILVRYGASLLSGKPFEMAEIASVSVKAVPWAFVIAAIRFSCNSLIANGNLVTKIAFPKEIFPLAAVLSQLFDLAIAAGLLVIVLTVAKVGVSLQLLWVPLIVLQLVLLVTGAGILVAAAALYFRDVKYLVEVFLTFAIFFTPVFFDVAMFGEWGKLLLLNPIAPLLEALDATIVRQTPPDRFWLSYSALVAVVGVVVAYRLFKRVEPGFAENI